MIDNCPRPVVSARFVSNVVFHRQRSRRTPTIPSWLPGSGPRSRVSRRGSGTVVVVVQDNFWKIPTTSLSKQTNQLPSQWAPFGQLLRARSSSSPAPTIYLEATYLSKHYYYSAGRIRPVSASVHSSPRRSESITTQCSIKGLLTSESSPSKTRGGVPPYQPRC
ncbi:hypothetical protein BO94DRAFT_532760 [Aspergillus sclerotioniger CBS 115572]|uniref:Uncharacterized protein n=1 Tax=Aspergillus sclerotioniger CBS 115572 TaxID=1450535 RepID=A0A317X834_9EURO|nr:hypothetical protein BO94DRAFT_532760 [Aspergillus sclerotioniger CBS 115572]PWY93812.1 hypothetical protein BO94DRAFT_532760 [Aspergillus sclerotioniger CBS 115572]